MSGRVAARVEPGARVNSEPEDMVGLDVGLGSTLTRRLVLGLRLGCWLELPP